MTPVSQLVSRGSSPSLSDSPSVSDQSSLPYAPSATSSANDIKLPASATIAERMHRYEELMMTAHIAGLELALDLRRAQIEAGMTAITGHAVFARFDEAQLQLSTAIGIAAAGHRLVRAMAPVAGIDPEAYGEATDPAEAVARPNLQQVA